MFIYIKIDYILKLVSLIGEDEHINTEKKRELKMLKERSDIVLLTTNFKIGFWFTGYTLHSFA
jgi:hypothetical protein